MISQYLLAVKVENYNYVVKFPYKDSCNIELKNCNSQRSIIWDYSAMVKTLNQVKFIQINNEANDNQIQKNNINFFPKLFEKKNFEIKKNKKKVSIKNENVKITVKNEHLNFFKKYPFLLYPLYKTHFSKEKSIYNELIRSLMKNRFFLTPEIEFKKKAPTQGSLVIENKTHRKNVTLHIKKPEKNNGICSIQ